MCLQQQLGYVAVPNWIRLDFVVKISLLTATVSLHVCTKVAQFLEAYAGPAAAKIAEVFDLEATLTLIDPTYRMMHDVTMTSTHHGQLYSLN